MDSKEKVALSFFPLIIQDFKFTVYRKKYIAGEVISDYPDCSRRRLPPSINQKTQGDQSYAEYWITFEQKKGFEEFVCLSYTNIYLTEELIFRLLKNSCRKKLGKNDYVISNGFNNKRIIFVLQRFPEGQQTVWLEPYYLKTAKVFGFLADFKFFSSGQKLNRRILQLSLSLDKENRSNKNFYVDRYEQLKVFLDRYYEKIFPLEHYSLEINIQKNLFTLETKRLETKEYIFADGKRGNSQFTGLKSHGPLGPAPDETKVYFIFREEDRPFSYDLYHALKGDTFSNNFPGMAAMFRFDFSHNVGGKPINDYSPETIKEAIRAIEVDANGRPVIPIMIIPFKRGSGDQASEMYHKAKHAFLRYHIPSQFVSLPELQSKEKLKWSVSNIGLQLFAKMGGKPWKVNPKTNNCLIVGIGQSHKKRNGKIEKFFAYSVLTESTGLYKELKILSRASDKKVYLESFKSSLKSIFERYYEDYQSFVIHATFSIRGDELDAVKNVLDGLASVNKTRKEFVVMKFNDKNKFFAYSQTNNSMIPFESSFLKLSNNEYLVWFEGIQYQNPKIFKKIERPLYVEFIYPTKEKDLGEEKKIALLQDAVNISGANWRGFNAKSLPVSVYYAYLVASYYKEFQDLGLEEIDIEEIKPWFL